MTATSMYHFGVLVHDMEAAITRFESLFGLTFNEPTVVHLNRLADPDEHPFDLRATYSRQGPPHMELLESKGFGVYGAHHGEGVHHIGMWDSAISPNMIQFGAQGLEVEAQILTPDGNPFAWYAKPAGAHGTRFEFVDDAGRLDIEKWMATGVMDGPGGFVV